MMVFCEPATERIGAAHHPAGIVAGMKRLMHAEKETAYVHTETI